MNEMTRNLASKTIQEVRKRKSKIFGFKHTLTNEGIQDKKKRIVVKIRL